MSQMESCALHKLEGADDAIGISTKDILDFFGGFPKYNQVLQMRNMNIINKLNWDIKEKGLQYVRTEYMKQEKLVDYDFQQKLLANESKQALNATQVAEIVFSFIRQFEQQGKLIP
eukprot:UN00645